MFDDRDAIKIGIKFSLEGIEKERGKKKEEEERKGKSDGSSIRDLIVMTYFFINSRAHRIRSRMCAILYGEGRKIFYIFKRDVHRV